MNFNKMAIIIRIISIATITAQRENHTKLVIYNLLPPIRNTNIFNRYLLKKSKQKGKKVK